MFSNVLIPKMGWSQWTFLGSDETRSVEFNCDFSLASATHWLMCSHHFPHSNGQSGKSMISPWVSGHMFHFLSVFLWGKSPTFWGTTPEPTPLPRLLEGISIFDLQNPPKPMPQELVFVPPGWHVKNGRTKKHHLFGIEIGLFFWCKTRKYWFSKAL